jgi:hypothetical protein
VRSACLPASPILSLTFNSRRFINSLPLVVVVAIDLRTVAHVGHPVGKGLARKVEARLLRKSMLCSFNRKIHTHHGNSGRNVNLPSQFFLRHVYSRSHAT